MSFFGALRREAGGALSALLSLPARGKFQRRGRKLTSPLKSGEGNKNFYKGKGGRKEGRHTKTGTWPRAASAAAALRASLERRRPPLTRAPCSCTACRKVFARPRDATEYSGARLDWVQGAPQPLTHHTPTSAPLPHREQFMHANVAHKYSFFRHTRQLKPYVALRTPLVKMRPQSTLKPDEPVSPVSPSVAPKA